MSAAVSAAGPSCAEILATAAAAYAKVHGLATADAIIFATADDARADLLTCDAHFAKLPRVVYIAKGSP